MSLVVVLIAGPLVFVFFTSFKDQPDIYSQPTTWWPPRWHPQNYRTATEQIPFWTFLRNSVVITSALAVVKFMLGVLSAFGLVFVRFPGKNVVFLVIIAALMVPNQITVISNYALISQLGMRNTFPGIILPLAGVAFGTFLMRNHFLSLPPRSSKRPEWMGRAGGNFSCGWCCRCRGPPWWPSASLLWSMNGMSTCGRS
ncbi:hypothetical protein NIIDMKKI_47940 [Mycobacterium kansasii]|uniref:Uncharacterized protein n=1 Tax=Mycobacterium kansasii TaxID=1768 RepID=A0A7G1ILU3_MYCKA|nr:putative sN-glycerol-3-phosphate transport integral membrane protein ABC transporter UgpE [Mycobacterium kansasii 824]BCI89588.1 hypothetical protein NIIDMKKI_47940 [Mycobacterium kansasii]